jgi:hypothetical protein
MEMKVSKVAQFLAGTLDMDDTRNKNSLYIELAEKISYGNKDDISAALAVTEKVREATGREPEFESYVPGMPKRCLGQDIREGYITPSEDAIRMHKDLTGGDLPGIAYPSAQEIAFKDAEVGAQAAGFQTGHPLSGPDKMYYEDLQNKSPQNKSFDQEGPDLTFGPSKVIKGALSNNMEEVVKGLKETNSIGASKDLEESLKAISNPSGIAKYLIDGFKENSWMPGAIGLASQAVGLNTYLQKPSPSKDVSASDRESKETSQTLGEQLMNELVKLVSPPALALKNIADAYEKGIEATVGKTRDSILENSIKGPDESKEINTKEWLKEIEALSEQAKALPNTQQKAEPKTFSELIDGVKEMLFQSPTGNAVKSAFDINKMRDDMVGVPTGSISDKLMDNISQNLQSPGNAVKSAFDVNKMRDDMVGVPTETISDKRMDNISQNLQSPGNTMSRIFDEWATIQSKRDGVEAGRTLDPNMEKVELEDLSNAFAKQMALGHLTAHSLSDHLKNGIKEGFDKESSDSLISAMERDPQINKALDINDNNEWKALYGMFKDGASPQDLNEQMSLNSMSKPWTVAERTKDLVDNFIAFGKEGLEQSIQKAGGAGDPKGPNNPTSGFGIIPEGGQKAPNKDSGPEQGEGQGPGASLNSPKGVGGALEEMAGSIARGITYSVARKRGLGPKESGEMAEAAGKEAEDVTRIAASSKENVNQALGDIKTAKNTAAKGLSAATTLIPNPAVGKAVAIGIAMADKATDFVIDLVNNQGNATNKLMDTTSSQSPAQSQTKSQGDIAGAGAGLATNIGEGANSLSPNYMTMDAFRDSLQKDRKGLTKKLIPKDDFITSGAQTAINSIGSWGSKEIKKANETPQVDQMHKMIDNPA